MPWSVTSFWKNKRYVYLYTENLGHNIKELLCGCLLTPGEMLINSHLKNLMFYSIFLKLPSVQSAPGENVTSYIKI